ncbi:hypothetical protein R1flu_000095 [Riccia fluitans]|uniref:Uncharacterized protein n=1 Tax=Riccia fluitans TaxID=41844 RepID=A0ABD1XZH8_9MARC
MSRDGSFAPVNRYIHLKAQRRLKNLRFHDVHPSNDNFRSLMNLLQVNIYLEDVNVSIMTEWESQGKWAMVRKALRKKQGTGVLSLCCGTPGCHLRMPESGGSSYVVILMQGKKFFGPFKQCFLPL